MCKNKNYGTASYKWHGTASYKWHGTASYIKQLGNKGTINIYKKHGAASYIKQLGNKGTINIINSLLLFAVLFIGLWFVAGSGDRDQWVRGGKSVAISERNTALASGEAGEKKGAADKKPVWGRKGEIRVVHIRRGMSLNQVVREMRRLGVIKSVWRFKLLAWWRRASMRIQSGEYALKVGSSAGEILDILVNGNIRLHKLTFPEGYNLFEMADVLEREGFAEKERFIALSHNRRWIKGLGLGDLDSLEGYLFPDTYYVSRPVQPKVLVRQMVRRFSVVYKRLKSVYMKKPRPVALTRHKVVILASIVEKETGAAWERPLIASVFFNRLQRGMRFESDPTILYGMLKETGVMPVNIQKRDILRKTAYNTYKVRGWPAGPIANPGEQALKAVFWPKKSPYLYFVSRNDGTHVFSKTYREHKRAVNRWQKKIARKK